MGIMEQKMETTRVYWGYTGIMAEKMETTIFKPGTAFPTRTTMLRKGAQLKSPEVDQAGRP